MTYLNLVNGVLRRLREDEVSNVSESTYSKMVGDYVNDAKDLVETAWDWSPLRSTLTITTSNGDNLYSLTGSRNEGKVLNFINDTSNCLVEYQTQNWFDDRTLSKRPSQAHLNTLLMPVLIVAVILKSSYIQHRIRHIP